MSTHSDKQASFNLQPSCYDFFSLYIFDSKQICLYSVVLSLVSFLFPFLKNISIFASFHVLGMRRSVLHFVYSLASCFAMVSFPTFSISMLAGSFLDSFPFFIFLSAVSTSHGIIGDTSSGSVCIVTAWSLSYG